SSRAWSARTGAAARVSSIVTSPVAESTAIVVPVLSWSRRFVSPSGPMRTPSLSAGIRAYNMSASEDRLLETRWTRVDSEPPEIADRVHDVPSEPLLGAGVIQWDRLPDVDHDDLV